MARSGMRDVILADDGDADDGEPARPEPSSARPEETAGRGPSRRRRRLRWLALAVVLLVAVAGAVVAGRRQDPVAAARLAGDPVVLDRLDRPVAELWRAPFGFADIFTLRGDVVVAGHHVERRPRLTTVETATGATRWSVPISDGVEEDLGACEAFGDPTTAVSTHVACRVVTIDAPPGGGGDAPRARLVVWDARTGAVVRERPLMRSLATLTTLGQDLVVADVRDDGHLVVTREDVATGRQRWSVVSAGEVPGVVQVPQFEPDGDGRLVADGGVAVALAPDGAVLWEWGAPPASDLPDVGDVVDVAVLPDGEVAVAGLDLSGTELVHGGVWSAAGRPLYPLPGPVLVPAPDDGTADDLVITRTPAGDEVLALDRETGEERWRTRTGQVGRSLLLDRRLVVNTLAEVLAVDTRTGRVLWRAAVPPGSEEVFTDGRRVVVPVNDRGTQSLAALDVTDGRVRWSVPAPDHVELWGASGGLLYAVRPDDVRAFGPPREVMTAARPAAR